MAKEESGGKFPLLLDHTVDGNPKEKRKEKIKEKIKRRNAKMSWSKQREWNLMDKEVKEEKGKKKKRRKGRETNRERIEKESYREREREKGERNKKGRFSRHFDGQNSTVREEKSIHTTPATRGF